MEQLKGRPTSGNVARMLKKIVTQNLEDSTNLVMDLKILMPKEVIGKTGIPEMANQNYHSLVSLKTNIRTTFQATTIVTTIIKTTTTFITNREEASITKAAIVEITDQAIEGLQNYLIRTSQRSGQQQRKLRLQLQHSERLSSFDRRSIHIAFIIVFFLLDSF